MDPRYAAFIWGSFGLAIAVVLWNVLAPVLARNSLMQRLSEQQEEARDHDA